MQNIMGTHDRDHNEERVTFCFAQEADFAKSGPHPKKQHKYATKLQEHRSLANMAGKSMGGGQLSL